MKITTTQILKLLRIVSWIIFIGLCFETGGYLFNTFYCLIYNPNGAKNFWSGVDLSDILQFNRNYFIIFTLNLIIIGVLKTIMFYFTVKIFEDKKINLDQPFNIEMQKYITQLSYITLTIALFTYFVTKVLKILINENLFLKNLEILKLGYADVWFFIGIVLYIISKIFKRGLELQQENEYTI